MIHAAMVNVIYNGDFYKLYAMSNAGIHFLELEAPIFYFNKTASETELGEAVFNLLPYCKKIDALLFKQLIPKINEASKIRDADEMQKYGYSSRKKLYESNINCDVYFFKNKHQFEITPTHHDSMAGYSGINKAFCINASSTEQEIGQAIKKGLRMCTTKSSLKLPEVF